MLPCTDIGSANPYDYSKISTSPTIGSDGTLSYIGSAAFDLYAVKPDGTLKWKYLVGPVLSPAVGADGTVYVGTTNAVCAINPFGTLKWKCALSSSIYSANISSPEIAQNDTIYVSYVDGLYAVNPNGALKWKCPLTGYISSPSIGGTARFT